MYRRTKCNSPNGKTLRRKHKGKSSGPQIWQWTLRHDTKSTNSKRKNR